MRERGVTPLTVDVSEFLKKGGGSVKCMIGDLGPIRPDQVRGTYAARALRKGTDLFFKKLTASVESLAARVSFLKKRPVPFLKQRAEEDALAQAPVARR